MIGIINYGLGNVQAFISIYDSLGIPCKKISSINDINNVDKLILPGVGSFDWAMKKLINSGMKDIINDLVINHQIPILGVCVGMQLMADSSEEGVLKGFGWISGEVKRFNFKNSSEQLYLPHMGWNNIKVKSSLLTDGINNPSFYFLHSYYFSPSVEKYSLSYTNYGINFASAIFKNNIYGVQFHPEKSHGSGIQLLTNFSRL